MYMNRDEKMKSNSGSRDYDVCTTENGCKFLVKWSPQEDVQFYSTNRFGSARMLSKSLPRRNKHMAKMRISRSLNFDMGSMSNNSMSPNSSSEGSSFEDNRNLSRSAKIMKALRNSSSPVHVSTRKINKSLNFDLSPSPKKSLNSIKSPQSIMSVNFSSPSPAISRNLNYDSNGSMSSLVGTSVESIDENQNQTPSQQRRIVKKSLRYSSPLPDSMSGSPYNIRTSTLRPGLKAKIDDIVKLNLTPNSTPFKSVKKLPVLGHDNSSTPRNLFQDFLEDSDRPRTPENMFRVIPESMSAIKKSHKKERSARRLVNGQSIDCVNEALKEDKRKETTKDRPSTPITNDSHVSPTFSVNSIKQSHKKDKSKRKTSVSNSEDDMSDTGSIFSYSHEKDDAESQQICTSSGNSPQANDVTESNSTNILIETRANFSTPDTKREKRLQKPVCELEIASDEIEKNISPAIVIHSSESPSVRPGTPENRINFLQEVMKSSIKKSHKKLKDDRKKRLLRPRMLEANTPVRPRVLHHCNNDNELLNTSNTENRAATPENINSSRLLLNHFSSVKKSHKKIKHKKMLSSFVRRQKYINAECDKIEGEHQDVESAMEITSLNYETIPSGNISCQLSFSPETSSSNELLKENKENFQISALTEVPESSPKKRKNPSDNILNSCSLLKISPDASTSTEYQHDNEDFKIFTPIKKRRSYHRIPVELKVNNSSDALPDDGVEKICTSRCETPTTLLPECLDSQTESNVVTSVANISLSSSPNKSPIAMVNSPQDAPVDSNGRRTPNNTCMEPVIQISSIKKSHKKDKRASKLRRNTAANIELSLAKKADNSVKDNGLASAENEAISMNPGPSTSNDGLCTKDLASESFLKIKTPPNCSKVKAYMKLVQSASIKRSHKKVRERKRMSWLIQDYNGSDDGSIFSDEDKTQSRRRVVQTIDCAIEKLNDVGINDTNRVDVPTFEDVQQATGEETNEQVSSLQHGGASIYYENRSDDGSIFDEEERLESLHDDLKLSEAAESAHAKED